MLPRSAHPDEFFGHRRLFPNKNNRQTYWRSASKQRTDLGHRPSSTGPWTRCQMIGAPGSNQCIFGFLPPNSCKTCHSPSFLTCLLAGSFGLSPFNLRSLSDQSPFADGDSPQNGWGLNPLCPNDLRAKMGSG